MAGIDRRTFLQRATAGVALASVPGWLPACGPGAPGLPAPTARAGAGAGAAGQAAASLPSLYFEAFGVGPELLRKVMSRGLARGGEHCEVFLQHRVRHWLGLQDGEVNRAYAAVDLGAGVRVLKGEATGYAYCEELTQDALLGAAATAAAVADASPTVNPAAWAPIRCAGRYPVQRHWTDISVSDKLPIVQRADRTARATDRRIVKVVAFLEDETSHVLIADSLGRLVQDVQPMALLRVSCTAEQNGVTESSRYSSSQRNDLRFLTDAEVDNTARRAAQFTVRLFDAAPPPPGEYPVVLAPGLSGILLHEAIGHGMEADFNRKGTSIYAGRIGKRIAPAGVTIVDDGTNERLRGSIDVDDEGTPTERTVLVRDGILRSYLHDRLSAKHYATELTGSGRRQSFRFPPVPRMRNTYMEAGPLAPEEVIASVKKGIYAEYFHNGQVLIGAGDFTFYLKHGRMIEDGKLTHGIKDANLIGNGPKVLETVDMVASDLALYSGGGWCGKDGQRVPVSFGLPTVRAGSISVGGRKA